MFSLHDFLQENQVDIAVLAVPGKIANTTANAVVEDGVKGIWNFTNVELSVDKPDVVIENIHFSDSLLVLSYLLSNAKTDEDAEF